MIKSTIAAVAAPPFLFAGAAFAGPYVNLEATGSYPEGAYTEGGIEAVVGYEGATEFTGKVGYEGSLTSTSYFVEGGPVTTSPDGGDTSTEFFVAGGLGVPITDSIGAKVSLKYESNDGGDNKYELKSGLKYKF